MYEYFLSDRWDEHRVHVALGGEIVICFRIYFFHCVKLGDERVGKRIENILPEKDE